MLLSMSDHLQFNDIDAPNHFHLAHGLKQGTMVVMFETASRRPDMMFRWGYSPDARIYKAEATVETYSRRDFTDQPAAAQGYLVSPFFHSVELPGLVGGKEVYYSVGSVEGSFLVPIGAKRGATLNVIAIADIGVTYQDGSQYHWQEALAQSTLDLSRRLRQADLALLVGDLAYATGYLSKWDYCKYAASKPQLNNLSHESYRANRVQGSIYDRSRQPRERL